MAVDWLKLHRKSIESRVFSDAHLWRLWCWCLIKSNWKRGWYGGCELLPGQFAIGREAASEELGVSGSAWYRGMQKLQEIGCIKLAANNRFTIVSVTNWHRYQGDVNNKRTTDEQQADSQRTTGEQQADTIEEGEEVKEVKKDKNNTFVGFENWWKIYPRRVAPEKAKQAYSKVLQRISTERQLNMSDAAELLLKLTSERVGAIASFEKQFQPHPASWLNSGRYTDDIEEPPIIDSGLKGRRTTFEEFGL